LIRVDGPTLAVTAGDGPADITFAAGPDIRLLIAGTITPARAMSSGVVELVRGPGALLDRFASTFHLSALNA
jgi:hypothetical protein